MGTVQIICIIIAVILIITPTWFINEVIRRISRK